jgi:hypothetical protein
MRRPRHALILLILALAAASGCATAPPKQTPAMKALGQTELSKRELQMLIYQYGYHYAGQVELVTSDIVAETKDRAIRSSAITWNTIGVPEMMRSCFNNDPMVGLILAWIYAAQVREYLDTGHGSTVFGPYQSRVVEVSRRLESEARGIAYGILPRDKADSLAQRAATWVEQHPLRNHRFVREGFSRDMLTAMGTDVKGGLAAAGEMNEQMIGITDRTNLMMAYLPRQLEWQTAAALEQSETVVAQMTDSTLAAVAREATANLEPVFEFGDEQRRLMTADLERERIAVLEHISKERMHVLEDLHRQRSETLVELHRMTLDAIEKASGEGRLISQEAIDRVFLRLGSMFLIPIVAFFVALIGGFVWLNRLAERLLRIRELEASRPSER